MINKYKKYILLFLALLTVAAIGYIIISVKEKPVTPTTVSIKPRLTQEYKGQYLLEIGFDEKQFKYVEKLPFVEITKTVMPNQKAQEIATALGFTGSPTSVKDAIDGPTLFWNNGKATLFIYPDRNKVTYSSSRDVFAIDKQMSDENIRLTALNFLEENKIVEKGSLTVTNLEFLKKNTSQEGYVGSTKSEASLYRVDFTPAEAGYEIVSATLITPPVFVLMTKDGIISSFQSVLPGAARTLPVEYRLKNYDEMQNSTKDAVLISVLGQYSPLSNLSENLIQKITVNQVSLAYLQETINSTVLIPIYKLSGEASVSNSPNNVPVVLYLSAVADN
jgi:hypothetical protein